MKQMFNCENGDSFSLDDCIGVSVLRPDEVQKIFEDEGVAYYAKVYISDIQNVSLVCHNIVRKDYDCLVKKKEMFRCGNDDLFSLNTCISMSMLRPEVVRQLLKEDGVTYYAKLFITDASKNFLFCHNITHSDYDRLSGVYIDPISGNHI